MRLKRVVAVLLVAAMCLSPKAPALANTTSSRAPVGRTIGTAAAKGAVRQWSLPPSQPSSSGACW